MSTADKTTANIRWAFFGSSRFSVLVLDELETLGMTPKLVVTTPDKPKGRGLKTSANEVRVWAESRHIRVIAPAALKTPEILEELNADGPWDIFLIASYGKIVPIDILDIPARGTLNIHPSLLPKLRGASPIETAVLEENETGVTIMKVDEQVDHGPIVAKRPVQTKEWPPYAVDLEILLAKEGARLFFETITQWVNGRVEAREQDHDSATFSKKFSKEDLLIDLASENPEREMRKIRAFSNNRGAYYFLDQNGEQKRIIITRAHIEDGRLALDAVKPEGKKEMLYKDFLNGLR